MNWPEASVFLGPELVGLGRSHEAVRVARVLDQHEAREILARSLIPGWPEGERVSHDGLGRPLAAVSGFHVSFSRLHRPDEPVLTYAAACESGGGIRGLGIDAAHASDFGAEYPRQRVFAASELALLRANFSSAREQELLALAWACKESAVKALGCGFHHCEPRDVVGVECLPHGDMLAVRMRVQCRRPSEDVNCLAWEEDGSWVVVGVVCSRG
jgi:hypothetical protein